MPTSQHTTPERRCAKTSHHPAKTVNIAPKTALAAPNYPHVPPSIPTQMRGNERKREGFRKNNSLPRA